MQHPPDETVTLEDLIAECIRAEDAGQKIDRHELLTRYPQHSEELQKFFSNCDQLRNIARPVAVSRPGLHAKLSYVGDYELLEQIACGGMGIVFKARQTSLNRTVAVKMILAGQLASDDAVKRFRAEAEAAASLHHPNIVAVHEVGLHQGHHYFSMDYVEGRSLAEIVREHPLAAREAAGFVRQISEAVHYAHQQGTLHRDLKPSNVLIDSNRQVRVTDFGLALRVSDDRALTLTGQAVGTPSYMAPEQARGLRSLIGPASDVYSLGAILYELLTGRPPFRADTAVETLRQAMHEEPAAPRLLNAKTPRDLETICLKCLQKESHKRYPTAQHLSDDLKRYLADEPIHARPISFIARLWRWRRRNPIVAGLLATAAALLVAVASIASVAYVREAKLHAQAENLSQKIRTAYGSVSELKTKELELRAEMQAAEQALDAAKQRTANLEQDYRQLEQQRQTLLSTLEGRQQKLYSTLLDLARADWEAGEVARADGYLEDCPLSLRDQRWRRLKHLCRPEQRTFTGTRALAIGDKGRLVAGARLRPHGSDGQADEIVISDFGTQQVIKTIPCDTTINVLAFAPDGSKVYSGGENGQIYVWDLESGARLSALIGHTHPITCLSLSADGSMLASASLGDPRNFPPQGEVLLWDIPAGTIRKTFSGNRAVALDPAGRRIAYNSSEIVNSNRVDFVQVADLDPSAAAATTQLFRIEGAVSHCLFSFDGSLLAVNKYGSVEIWNTADKARMSQFRVYRSGKLAFSRDASRFAYNIVGNKEIRDRSADSIVVRNLHSGERERLLPWYDSEISALEFSADGEWIVTVDQQDVKAWNVTPSEDPTELILADIRQLNVGPYDWPQWGGSRCRVNTPAGVNIPSTWQPGSVEYQTGEWNREGSKNVKWVAKLGSQTYGNPVVANGKIFVGTNNGAGYLKRYPTEIDLGVLLCFDEKSGEFLWQDSNEKLPTGRVHDWPQQGVCSTPAVDADRLWYVNNRGEVVCLDTEGFADGEDDGPMRDVRQKLFDLPEDLERVINDRAVSEIGWNWNEGVIKVFMRALRLPADRADIEFKPATKHWSYYVKEPAGYVEKYHLSIQNGELRVWNGAEGTSSERLTSIGVNLLEGLDDSRVGATLRMILASKGVELSESAQVSNEGKDQWLIVDSTATGQRKVYLRRSGHRLICESSLTLPGDREADVIWKLDMMKEMGVSQHNMSNCSPLIIGDWLFVCTSNGTDETHTYIPSPNAPSFICLNRWTGEVLWTDNSPGNNILHAQWASPSYGIFADQPQVIFPGGDGWVYSFDPAGNGRGGAKLLWKFDGNFKDSRYSIAGRSTRNEIIAFPAIYDGLVYIVMGQDPEHGEGEGCLWCIDPAKHMDGSDVSEQLAVDSQGNLIPFKKLQAVDAKLGERAIPNPKSAVVWRYTADDRNGDGVVEFVEQFHRSLAIPVIKDDILYVADFSGLFHCLNAKTGKVYWAYDQLAACWNSALLVDDKVYVGDEDGDISIFRHSADPAKAMPDGPAYGAVEMGNPVYMTPVVANNVLYIATRSHLFAISSDDADAGQLRANR